MPAECCPDSLHDPAMKGIGNSQLREYQISLTALHGDQGTLHGDQGTLHGDQGTLHGDHGTLHAQPCGICYRQAQAQSAQSVCVVRAKPSSISQILSETHTS